MEPNTSIACTQGRKLRRAVLMQNPLPGMIIADAVLSARRDMDGIKACKKFMKLVLRHVGGAEAENVRPMMGTETAGGLVESSRVANKFLRDHCQRCGLCELGER